ncbi:gametocyte-specific factor 1 homolog [Condylostylus longicornis]|uniref:gametocyte-specific factor 1 homolog n=1 Tax=Condylostylus longicornis TaxID=2530218 RepID=UPI00244DD703|nr:gametocyte-specific factor 1 homolog [Condylostylus longicornis]
MDEYVTCPFNKAHRILKFRMPRHIIKCQLNYRGDPLEQCPYNAQHFIKEGTLAEHLNSCEDYEIASMEDFRIDYKYKC